MKPLIEKGATLESEVTIWDHSTIKEGATLNSEVTIWDNSTIEEGATLNSEVTIWDNSTIEKGATLNSKVTIWDNCLIKEWCEIDSGTTVWKGSNLWMHSTVAYKVVIKENVTLWNYVKIQGPETIIGKKSVIWDNVSLPWDKDKGNDLKILKIWENCIIKGTPDIDSYFEGFYAPDKGLRYHRHSEKITTFWELLEKYKIWTEILPNVIIDEKGKFEGFRSLDEKKEPKSLKENRSLERILTSLKENRSLERILTSFSDIVFKDIK